MHTNSQLALNIVYSAFANKKDRGGQPYVEHLKRVAENAKYFYPSSIETAINELEIIALLHDLMEDCPHWSLKHIKDMFNSSTISNALDLLTKKQDDIYEEYIMKISHNSYARAVKLADLQDNLNLARLNITELTLGDVDRINKYLRAYKYLSTINDK